MRLGLGTVQFGMPYGISNTKGQPNRETVAAILKTATNAGINLLDTAVLYGESESLLGSLYEAKQFNIVTKLPSLAGQEALETKIQTYWQSSLDRLKTNQLYGLMLHCADDLLSPQGPWIWDGLMALKAAGQVQRLGVSIYSAEQIDAIIDRYPIDLIQLPINVFDQRLLTQGYLSALKNRQIEIHARSAFLQGLLLLSPDQVPAYFAPIQSHIEAYHAWRKANALTTTEAALSFVLGIKEIDRVMIGVNSEQELVENLNAANKTQYHDQFKLFALDSECFLNPSCWG